MNWYEPDGGKPALIRFLPDKRYGVFYCSHCEYRSGYWYSVHDDVFECTECAYGFITVK